MSKPTVDSFEQTCDSHPSQWSGLTTDGREIYIRYRWGGLSVDVAGHRILFIAYGDHYDGKLSTAAMKDLTSAILDWQEVGRGGR